MTTEKQHEPFWCPIKVRFGDVDPAGVVYYPSFMDYFHVALEEFMENGLKLPYPKLIRKDRMGFPTVRVECNFTRPVRYGDELSIRVWISRLGGASAVFEFEARKKGNVCARATLTKVALDLDKWKPMVMPGHIREALEKYLEPPEADSD
ncbi:MAG: thioesterase family protein [Planctomycetota bacterium]|nr:thioesterase family protein [Planctomycetota bacterium]